MALFSHFTAKLIKWNSLNEHLLFQLYINFSLFLIVLALTDEWMEMEISLLPFAHTHIHSSCEQTRSHNVRISRIIMLLCMHSSGWKKARWSIVYLISFYFALLRSAAVATATFSIALNQVSTERHCYNWWVLSIDDVCAFLAQLIEAKELCGSTQAIFSGSVKYEDFFALRKREEAASQSQHFILHLRGWRMSEEWVDRAKRNNDTKWWKKIRLCI